MADLGLKLAVTVQQMRITWRNRRLRIMMSRKRRNRKRNRKRIIMKDQHENDHKNEHEVLDDPVDEQPGDIPEHQIGF